MAVLVAEAADAREADVGDEAFRVDGEAQAGIEILALNRRDRLLLELHRVPEELGEPPAVGVLLAVAEKSPEVFIDPDFVPAAEPE